MKFKEMSKRAKVYIIFMFICGVSDIIFSILLKNVWTLFVGIMFLLEILETYTKEEKDRIINIMMYVIVKKKCLNGQYKE